MTLNECSKRAWHDCFVCVYKLNRKRLRREKGGSGTR